MTTNTNLHKARKARQDEFYTQLCDIEKELQHYPGAFQDKVIYLSTDDPKHSQFWAFFADNFATLGLKRLIATHFTPGATSSTATVKTHAGTTAYSIEGDGDFRSEECVELLRQSDIVVSNPPFSLFREYVAQLVEHEKHFVILGNQNAITYKEVWPLIQGGKLWLGTKSNMAMQLAVPEGYWAKEGSPVDDMGRSIVTVPGIAWFTNLDHVRRHEELPLWKKYTPEEYPRYDNYDAINVDKVKEIPVDYPGVIGVPITFLGKHNPEQFEIVGQSRMVAEVIEVDGKRISDLVYRKPDGSLKYPYMRVMIRNLNPETPTVESA